MEISLDFDLEKIAGLEGTSFFIAGYWASGDDLSDTDIGNLIDVSQVFDGRTVRLGQMYLEQKLLDEALDVAVGRLSTRRRLRDLGPLRQLCQLGRQRQSVRVSREPALVHSGFGRSWGVRAIVQPIDQIYLAAGVYNADPESQGRRARRRFRAQPAGRRPRLRRGRLPVQPGRGRHRPARQRHDRRLLRQQRLRSGRGRGR